MIKDNNKNISLIIKLSVLLFILFALVKTYLYLNENERTLVSCDFENHTSKDGSLIYSTNNIIHKIKVVAENSQEQCRSGQNSLKVNKQEFVNLIELNNIGPDEVYKATIYRKSGTAGIVLQEPTAEKTKVYVFQKFSCETSEDGWEKIVVQLRTPPEYEGSKLKLYIWNPKKDVTYFDDLKIEQLEQMEYPDYDTINALNIFIEDLELKKLKKLRRRAFKRGVLITDKDSYVNALFSYEEKLMQGELRFKGDWLDHLKGDKWSFRIKLSDGAWRNICTFSLHTPASRSFINEWFIHKIFHENDILATRYEFIPVKINGIPLGLYAFEEHFQKQLLESNLRREAPIISFSEEVLWNRRSVQVRTNEDFIFASSVIEPFQKGRTLKNEDLFKKFIIAQNLLGSYKNGELNASEVFDIEQTAKYFAIQTVLGGYHGVVWHNIRFYYNPVTCLLEPMAYDCFSNYGIFTWGFTDIICDFKPTKNSTLPIYSPIYIDLITDREFIREYITQLRYFADEELIASYLKTHSEQILIYNNQIKYEFLNYNFDEKVFTEHAKMIGFAIDTFEFNLTRESYIDSLKQKSLATRNKPNTDIDKRFFSDYVVFYRNSETQISASISHANNIEIIGFGNKKGIETSASIKIENIQKANVHSKEFSVSNNANQYKYVYYKTPAYDTVYKSKVVEWPAPTTYNPRLDIISNSEDITKYINKKERVVRFKGNLTFENHVYTPKNYTVIIEPGTKINLINGAALIINSTVIANGTEDSPIKIHSSDKSANGFTVLQANEKSYLKHVIFDNLNTLNYNAWTLTGAVTFYESDVEFTNCKFTNNHCEDMLNTIRCDFYLNSCIIQNTLSDSHDSDYCTGTLESCTFTNNGNDAIDFSTSNVTISNCIINGAKDKGISVGENTKVKIIDVKISDVNIGIASKDLSHADIDGCIITDATYGFVLLQKKPEFGPATITASNCELNDIWTEFLIERYSTLIFNGKTYKGKNAKLKALFYE